jgi:hypothetical protein
MHTDSVWLLLQVSRTHERVGDLFAAMSKDRQDIGPFCEAVQLAGLAAGSRFVPHVSEIPTICPSASQGLHGRREALFGFSTEPEQLVAPFACCWE